MDKRAYLFILNPNSGTSRGDRAAIIAQTIHHHAGLFGAEATIVYTERRGHATSLVTEHLDRQHWTAVVAIGGDGTVNEIARSLTGTGVPLGILPLGSGNGLARHLGLPLALEPALLRLFQGKVITIDSASINEYPFFCTAGIGFDALVGWRFSEQQARGLATYVNVSMRSFWSYRAQKFRMNGVEEEAFLLCFANAGQFGNNAWIAPGADLQDGVLDLSWIKPFPKWMGATLVYQLFTRKLRPSRLIEYRRITHIVIETDDPPVIHYDGEPVQLATKRIEVKVHPGSLRVVV